MVRNCIARKGAGLLTCGSETSGSIRNVLAHDLIAYGTGTTLRLKSSMNRGGTVENIYMTRVEADGVTHILSVDLNWNRNIVILPCRKNMKEKMFLNTGLLC